MTAKTFDKIGLAEVMTVAQVADFLQLNKLTVYRYIRDGKLPAVKLGRTFRVLRTDVHGFLNAQRIGSGVRAQPAGRARPASTPARSQPERDTQVPQEVYIDPRQQEFGQPRETVITYNPLDWVIRGLH